MISPTLLSSSSSSSPKTFPVAAAAAAAPRKRGLHADSNQVSPHMASDAARAPSAAPEMVDLAQEEDDIEALRAQNALDLELDRVPQVREQLL
jgi:hypothetical protein